MELYCCHCGKELQNEKYGARWCDNCVEASDYLDDLIEDKKAPLE